MNNRRCPEEYPLEPPPDPIDYGDLEEKLTEALEDLGYSVYLRITGTDIDGTTFFFNGFLIEI